MEDHTCQSGDKDFHEYMGALENRIRDQDYCFLCAHRCSPDELTKEHIIPKWLQNKFELWDQQVTLLNDTLLPYRNLVVPCCKTCNQLSLKPVEDAVATALEQGIHAIRSLEKRILFLWLGKIFYGLLYKELFLLYDRSKARGRTIITADDLQRYGYHLFFLQAARKQVSLQNFNPSSIFVFNCQTPGEVKHRWDLCDHSPSMFIGLRMGCAGLIAILGDGGHAQTMFESAYVEEMDWPLHPIQFREICAQFAYRSTLLRGTRGYLIYSDSPHKVVQIPRMSKRSPYEEWNDAEYAKFLAHYCQMSYEEAFMGTGKVVTSLRDESGAMRLWDCNA